MLIRLLLSVAILSGCADPYGDAQKVDTIEAWTAFVDGNPKSPRRGMGEIRLEELYLAAARESKTLDSYDAYLNKFPKGRHIDAATKERREFLLSWARKTNTVASWEQYLKEYPATRSAGGREAKQRLNMVTHQDKIELGPVKMEQVNLAEDPKGPMNGYGFYVDVTNKGDVAIESMGLTITYLGAGGQSVGSGSWPVVATRLPGGLPMAEGFGKPIAPGETRQWEWTTGNISDDWSKKASIVATYINFVGE